MDQKPNNSLVFESAMSRLAAREWKQNRPKLWQALQSRGQLHESLSEAGRQADEYLERAQAQGTDYQAAEEVALRTWILLPDVDAEAEPLPIPPD